MALSLRSKNSRGTSVQVDYVVHLQEIKPWPPSQSLKSLRSVVLHWENGDRNSGSTSPVVPDLGEGKIEFNKSFKLQVTLSKEASLKKSGTRMFQKNVLELNLYEPRRDTVKGQHLGSAVVDLAEHGVIKETVSTSIPVNSKRSFTNTAQPVLFVKIQPVDKYGTNTSSRESLSKEASLDKDSKQSFAALMIEEYPEKVEIASCTDDDHVPSQSSLTNSSSVFELNGDFLQQKGPRKRLHCENNADVKNIGRTYNAETTLPLESVPAKSEMKLVTEPNAPIFAVIDQNGSTSQSSSTGLSSNSGSPQKGNDFVSDYPQRSLTPVPEESDSCCIHSLSSLTCAGAEEEIRSNKNMEGAVKDDSVYQVHEKLLECRVERKEGLGQPLRINYNGNSILERVGHVDRDIQMEKPSLVSISHIQMEEKPSLVSISHAEVNNDEDGLLEMSTSESVEVASSNCVQCPFMEENSEGRQFENTDNYTEETQNQPIGVKSFTDSPSCSSPSASISSMEHTRGNQPNGISQNPQRNQVTSDITMFSRRVLGGKYNSTLTRDGLKNMRLSSRSPPDSVGTIISVTSDRYTDIREIDIFEDACYGRVNFDTDAQISELENTSMSSDNVKHISRQPQYGFPPNKIRELELRIAMLQGELIEAAAIESSLYSIVPEHGISASKVHAPARRLSRLYTHASKQWSEERKASVARSAVSGLVLAAKACGNDVPRLTFWLSNLVVLRAIVSQAVSGSDPPISSDPHAETNSRKGSNKKSSPLKWESSVSKRERKLFFTGEFDNWEDPSTFTAALKKIEAWIFSRIIESVWWQTLTPHMQSTAESGESKMGLKESNRRQTSLDNLQQDNYPIDLWKKAFKDTFERLCPVRAGGHDCGCLLLLARLVMDQCVLRLDVAMFNAILREKTDDLPTDPVSDPISDPKVLPIPSGKSSFGAGARLKNAIGNWSGWLTALFDDDDSSEDVFKEDGDRQDVAKSLKYFRLLSALSDLLMLPKDMLLDRSIRNEVCPPFSDSMIRQILDGFMPDEFCPDLIPDMVLKALDSENPFETGEGVIRSCPCNAPPINYCPPSMDKVIGIIGEAHSQSLQRSGSSVLRKSHTSDDELDELSSPLTSIVIGETPALLSPNSKLRGKGGADIARYSLLREVWKYGY